MSISALYQTIVVAIGFFIYSLGYIQMNILTPLQCFYLGTVFILLAILRNIIDKRKRLANGNSIEDDGIKNLSPWIYFHSLMERWKISEQALRQIISTTELLGQRHVDYTDYASSQAIQDIFPVKKIKTEFDIIDDRLCFKRKDIEEFEKKCGF